MKRLIHGLLARFGYAIVRPMYGVHDDAFSAQQHLLGSDAVRVILDVGANLGQTSLRYESEFPKADIYAFEPFPVSYSELTARVAGRPRIHANNVAVLTGPGTARLNVNARSSTNSVFETSSEASRFVAADLMERTTTVEVDAVSLDSFCTLKGIVHVDVLKIDVQGAELLVLQGARNLLEEARIDLIYSEVLFAPLYDGQAGFPELHDHLSGLGYQLYGLFDLNYGRNGMLAWADAIWLSPERADAQPRRGS